MSESEKVLWERLRRRRIGFHVRRQFPVGNYYLDFYVEAAKLAIEVDGEQHILRQDQDQLRDAFLESVGITVLRLPSWELFEKESLQAWVDTIYHRSCELGGVPEPRKTPSRPSGTLPR